MSAATTRSPTDSSKAPEQAGVIARLLQRLRAGRPRAALRPAEGYRRWAADYGHQPNVFQQLEASVMDRLLPDVAGRTVLDLGCGKARVAALALERGAHHAVAADLALAMLVDREAPQHASLDRLTAATHPLPFRSASFDVVTCALVLGHVADLDAAIRAMTAVLRPGGSLVITDFHPYATLQGWRRTFVDDAGREHEIEQHLHLFEDYLRGFRDASVTVEALEEPRWEGNPVLFALRARKV